MTDGSNRFFALSEVLDNRNYFFIQTDVLRGSSTGNDQPIIVFWINFVKSGRQHKIVPGFFTIGLIADKIMNSCFDRLAFFLTRANSINLMANHGQHLERNHGLIILDIVSNQHQNLFYAHFYLPPMFLLFFSVFSSVYYYNP